MGGRGIVGQINTGKDQQNAKYLPDCDPIMLDAGAKKDGNRCIDACKRGGSVCPDSGDSKIVQKESQKRRQKSQVKDRI
jgi:hypothetical protein